MSSLEKVRATLRAWCIHERVVAACWNRPSGRWVVVGATEPDMVPREAFDRLVCSTCGVWLPLGPSNDEPREVQQEISAAFTVTFPGFVRFVHADYHDEGGDLEFREDCDGCHAEELMHRIAEHFAADAKAERRKARL